MTIKRRWMDGKGKVHEKVLKPGYKERIKMVIDDAEGKGYFTFRNGITHVISNDEIRFEERDTFLSKLFGMNITAEEGRDILFEKESINANLPGNYSSRDKIIGHRGKQVSFAWEPTLSPNSKK